MSSRLRCSSFPSYRRARATARQQNQLRARLVALLMDHDLSCDTIQLVVSGSEVTLRGRVSDPLTSLLAEDLVCSEPAVSGCSNRLLVG